jgi:hypothetical protein
METGQFGLHGVLVVQLVAMVIVHKPELVQIHHLLMGAKTVVLQTQKQYHKPALLNLVQWVRRYKLVFLIIYFPFHKNLIIVIKIGFQMETGQFGLHGVLVV